MQAKLKILLVSVCFLFPSLYAQQQVGLLTLGGGVLRPSDPRPSFFIEYKSVLPKCSWIRPQIGIMTENFHSLNAYAGVAFDIFVWKHWVITPSFSPGLYFRGKKTVKLWFPIEFRSCIEVAWVFPCKARVGFEYFHLSNASLSDRNPGVNTAAFFVSFPFGCGCF